MHSSLAEDSSGVNLISACGPASVYILSVVNVILYASGSFWFVGFLQDGMEIRGMVCSREGPTTRIILADIPFNQPPPNFWLHLGNESRCHLVKGAALIEQNMLFIFIFVATWIQSRSMLKTNFISADLSLSTNSDICDCITNIYTPTSYISPRDRFMLR